MSESPIPEWMTYEAVMELAEGRGLLWAYMPRNLAREVLRCWDLLETQANQLHNLREKQG